VTPHRLVLAGFTTALCLAGCKSGSSPAADAALADGPAAAEAVASDANGDSAIAPKNDAAALTNDATALPDEPVLRDMGGGDVAPDLRAADVLPADSAAATEIPAADHPAAETTAAERPGSDGPADVSRPEAAVPDGPPADVGGDAGCTGWTTLQRLSPAQASDLIATSNPIVINVHIPYAGDIPGTDVDIPYNNVDAIETYLNHDHCADLLLVCESGGMSLSAGNELIKRGYLRVRDLNGGMAAWVAAGYPLLKDGGA
jgi:rhodanese-related sulfurtransferase